jgi:hypothetical protein
MQIIKKKKYYYLKYSYRKGKKVITKEKYLGKTIPKDIKEIKESLLTEQKKLLHKKPKLKN